MSDNKFILQTLDKDPKIIGVFKDKEQIIAYLKLYKDINFYEWLKYSTETNTTFEYWLATHNLHYEFSDKKIVPKMMDWNQLDLDESVKHLEEKFMFDSSGTAKCVFNLIEFYKAYKHGKSS